MKVQQWTKVAESDTIPMQASTAEGGQPKGLIKTLVANGIQASASGGWIANKTHQDHESTDTLIDQLASKTVAGDLETLHAALLDRCRVLRNSSVQEEAKCGAGSPTKKAKTPKSKHYPHHNPEG